MQSTKAGCHALVLLAGLFAGRAEAADLIVYHDWGAPAEIAALNVLKGAMEDKGHRWISLAVPHTGGAGHRRSRPDRRPATRPNVFLEPSPAIYRAIGAPGTGVLTLDDQFEASGALANFPQVVRQSITVDGHIVKVPATIHADAMIFFNRAVAGAAGIDPARLDLA